MMHAARFTRMAAFVCVFLVIGPASVMSVVSNQSVASSQAYYRMIVGVAQDPDTLNPFAMTLSISYTINFLVYDTLNSIEPDLSPGPQLAQSWETNGDGTVWTFHMVEDAVWHDGWPVTAEDVNFTYNLILDNQREGALWIDYLSDVVNVKAKGTYDVEVTTSVPKATMLSNMVPILPKHIWSLIDPTKIDKIDPWDKTAFPDGPVGSGPLKLVSWDSISGEVVMVKNPDYFIDVVKVDEVLFKCFGDESVMVNALWSGSIDVAMDVPARLWNETLDEPGLAGQATGSLSFYELGVNCASAEWREGFTKASDNLETTNLSVRQAIAMVTDKDYIVGNILKGFAEPGESIIPTATAFWHYFVPPEDRWDFDSDRANALLEAAGYRYVNSTTIRENSSSGVLLDFSLYYRMTYTDEESCARNLLDWLADIGINVRLTPVSEGVLWRAWMNCEYDLFIWGWDTDVDPNFMLSTMTEAQYPVDPKDSTKWGDAFWINEKYEELYKAQQNAVDLDERQAIVHEMQRILYYHCPYIVLYYPMGLYAYSTQKYTNFPDMVTYPGATPGSMWFFFAVTPIGEWVDLFPPENVDAGADRKCSQGETLSFSGSADDQDNLMEELNWTWTFSEPNGIIYKEYGQEVTYTFNNIGDVPVMLLVRDPDQQTGSDTLTVNVTQLSETAGWLNGTVKNQDLNPVSGATVNASGSVRTTDATGSYSMALEAGTYSVLVTKTGYTNDSATATVVSGETTWANFTIQLTSGVLEGTVFDRETGGPIAGAAVKITYGATTKNFSTNAQGFYQFSYVSEGTVKVNVTKSGYEYNATEVQMIAGETLTLDVYLDAVVVDDGGGVGTLALALLAVMAVVIAAVAVIFLMRKSKGEAPPPPPS